jgi:hypothetical protein
MHSHWVQGVYNGQLQDDLLVLFLSIHPPERIPLFPTGYPIAQHPQFSRLPVLNRQVRSLLFLQLQQDASQWRWHILNVKNLGLPPLP